MTTTDRHNWDIPTVGGSDDQWGTILNDVIDDEIEQHVWITNTVSSNHTLENYETLLVDASGGNVTITLPSVGNDVQVNIKKIDSSSNTVTIATPNTETIDGENSKTISNQYTNLTITSDGSNYFIV